MIPRSACVLIDCFCDFLIHFNAHCPLRRWNFDLPRYVSIVFRRLFVMGNSPKAFRFFEG